MLNIKKTQDESINNTLMIKNECYLQNPLTTLWTNYYLLLNADILSIWYKRFQYISRPCLFVMYSSYAVHRNCMYYRKDMPFNLCITIL